MKNYGDHPAASAGADFSKLQVPELKECCRVRRIRGYSKKLKPDLITLLNEYELADERTKEVYAVEVCLNASYSEWMPEATFELNYYEQNGLPYLKFYAQITGNNKGILINEGGCNETDALKFFHQGTGLYIDVNGRQKLIKAKDIVKCNVQIWHAVHDNEHRELNYFQLLGKGKKDLYPQLRLLYQLIQETEGDSISSSALVCDYFRCKSTFNQNRYRLEQLKVSCRSF